MDLVRRYSKLVIEFSKTLLQSNMKLKDPKSALSSNSLSGKTTQVVGSANSSSRNYYINPSASVRYDTGKTKIVLRKSKKI